MGNGELFFGVWYGFRILFITLIFIFLISGLDDLFLDLVHYTRVLHRRIFLHKRIKPVTREQLESLPEKPLAIMIPAWDESNIIQRMLLNTAGSLDYRNFYIFVGTYPNDEATFIEAEKAREIFPNVELVVTPKDGPTNKADCLNWIYQGILLFEKEHDIEFQIFLMHDAEDIIHPLWPKFANFLIPRVEFIQLPVFPLETPWHNFISGVYKDEFAENHTKDMRAREILADSIPSAGVGTALSRQTLAWLANKRRNQIFDIKSLTEDYMMGLILKDMPGRKIFLQQWIEQVHQSEEPGTGRKIEKRIKQPIATREFFPNSFVSAIRQKSRWILGISLQGWGIGWTRSLGANYCLYRDRKALVTNLAVVAGYVVVFAWAAIAGVNSINQDVWIPPLIEPEEIYYKLLMLVLVLFVWRVLNRIGSTWRIYGPVDGFMAFPRLFVGNFVNFCATTMAIQRFISSKISGKTPAWGKTEHAWPSEDQLRKYHRKLGDLLLERRMITASQLEEALARQAKSGGKLGEILVDMGALWDEDLMFTLSRQQNKEAVEVDPYQRVDLIERVPREVAERYRVFPIDEVEGRLVLAMDTAVSNATTAESELTRELGGPVTLHNTTSADIDFAIQRGYGEPAEGAPTAPGDRLGPRLVRKGLISDTDLTEALRRQKRSQEKLGAILLDMGKISESDLNAELENRPS